MCGAGVVSRVYRRRQPFKNLMAVSRDESWDVESLALVLVDLTMSMTDPKGGLASLARDRGISDELDEYYNQVPTAIANASRLLSGFRAAGGHVIHTYLSRGESSPSFLSSIGWDEKVLGGTDSFPHDLVPIGDESVFPKDSLGVFASGPLSERLRTWQTTRIVLGGVTTNGSVAHTTREAVDRGFEVIIASDACAGETLELHLETLADLSGGPVRVRSTISTLSVLGLRG
jgi:nicotinamidase-related amidase